ncbi:hypothetical protein [Caballeronia sp. S22]|uniref:hypothetical protein n=1 Tax=Caballeronia sp. S22 TaxID=3137182 RepID=UPI0035305D61
MAHAFPPDHEKNDGTNGFERWAAEAPTAAVARVVLRLDEAITLKRRAAAARLTAQGSAVPLRPIKPSRLELAVIIALAEIYGVALYRDARFLPVIDFIADEGAVALVQRVMYGAVLDHDNSDDRPPVMAEDNARPADLLPEARVAFQFLCASRPDVFIAQANAALARLGLPRRQLPPSAGSHEEGDDD